MSISRTGLSDRVLMYCDVRDVWLKTLLHVSRYYAVKYYY